MILHLSFCVNGAVAESLISFVAGAAEPGGRARAGCGDDREWQDGDGAEHGVEPGVAQSAGDRHWLCIFWIIK